MALLRCLSVGRGNLGFLKSVPILSESRSYSVQCFSTSTFKKIDPTRLWDLGYFPLKKEEFNDSPIFDTSGMLSSLPDPTPMDSFATAPMLIGDMTLPKDLVYQMDSTLRKRRKKMNKHKHRKRLKAKRMTNKK